VKKIYINPQWQGGADLVTYNGAEEIIKYLAGQDYVLLPVSADEAEMAIKKNGIRGFDVLRKQMHSAYDRIQEDTPDKIFTLGGGCDADVPSIVYLSEKHQGDLTVIWLDAHGDLNTPGESASSLFYGMPLRSLMDDQCFGLLRNRCPLSISQIIHIGGRDFDEAESTFIKETGLVAYSVQDIQSDSDLIHRIVEGIRSDHIYIHLDLDVIDPVEFPNTPLPVAGGIHCKEVCYILDMLADKLVGLGVYEYAPSGARNAFIEKLIQFGITL
jgi:arginase